MKQERLKIGEIPAILWGEASEKLYLYVHGQNGDKEEAESFAALACGRGWQVLSVDLPGHGERRENAEAFVPWQAVPELKRVLKAARTRWGETALFASSIGAWFSMLAFADEPLTRCLFVSPVLDMNRLIQNMMRWAGVTRARLQAERTIPTAFGQTLSWEYLLYAQNHPILKWDCPTSILYAAQDDLTEPQVARDFAARFHCRLTIVEGEHWFHTPSQLQALARWTEEGLEAGLHEPRT